MDLDDIHRPSAGRYLLDILPREHFCKLNRLISSAGTGRLSDFHKLPKSWPYPKHFIKVLCRFSYLDTLTQILELGGIRFPAIPDCPAQERTQYAHKPALRL